MREIKKNQDLNWNKEIKLSLSLKELQLIYDSLMTTDYKSIIETDWYEENKIPYDINCFIGVGNAIDSILNDNGGLTE